MRMIFDAVIFRSPPSPSNPSTPIAAPTDLELLLAYADDEDHYLLSFNASRRLEWERHSYEEIVQIGSGAKDISISRQIHHALETMPSAPQIWGELRLVSMLATASALTLLPDSNCVTNAVGGAFIGCGVIASRICWQPLIHYLLYDHTALNKLVQVLVGVTEDQAITLNRAAGTMMLNLISRTEHSLPKLQELSVQRALDFANRSHDPFAIQYLAFINIRRPAVCIVPVLGRSECRWVRISSAGRAFQFDMSVDLHEKLTRLPPETSEPIIPIELLL